MTIFDSIRYPISDDPSIDELQALPDHFRDKYQEIVFSCYTCFNKAKLYRTIILEWEDPK